MECSYDPFRRTPWTSCVSLSRFVSYKRVAPKFQHSLSAVPLVIYLCGRIDPAGFQQLKSEYASIPLLHADISALLLSVHVGRMHKLHMPFPEPTV
jgi:hypothetical protein